MKKFAIPFLVLLIIVIYFLNNTRTNYYYISGFAQGSTYNITYASNKELNFADSIKNILDNFDLSLSTYMDHSLISSINQNKHVYTDSLFNRVFQLSRNVYELSDGAFDITVAPLVRAWGFGKDENINPGRENIDSILQFVGMHKIELINDSLQKSDPGIQLDVNAIAQGYSVDIVAAFLEKWGIQNYLVEIGGEVKCKGISTGRRPWRIGIEKPTEKREQEERTLEAYVELQDIALATSGNYRKFFEKDGIKFVHTINPKTGEMVKSNLLSATVLHKQCALADAFATTFMVLGLDESKRLIKELKNTEVFFIYADEKGRFKTWNTAGFDTILHMYENSQNK